MVLNQETDSRLSNIITDWFHSQNKAKRKRITDQTSSASKQPAKRFMFEYVHAIEVFRVVLTQKTI